jgi:hypothetical protein
MARAASSDTSAGYCHRVVDCQNSPKSSTNRNLRCKIVSERCRRTRTGRLSRPHSPQQMIPPRYTLPRSPSSVQFLDRAFYCSLRLHPPCPRSMRLCSTALTWTTLSRAQVRSRMRLLYVFHIVLSHIHRRPTILGLRFDVWLPGGGSPQEMFISPLYGLAERICVVSSHERFCANLPREFVCSCVDLLRFTRALRLLPAFACISTSRIPLGQIFY